MLQALAGAEGVDWAAGGLLPYPAQDTAAAVSLLHLLACGGFDSSSAAERELVAAVADRCLAAGVAIETLADGIYDNCVMKPNNAVTPLVLAASKGAALVAQVLLERGADARWARRAGAGWQRQCSGAGWAREACCRSVLPGGGRRLQAGLLLPSVCLPTRRYICEGDSVASFAARAGHLECLKVLLHSGHVPQHILLDAVNQVGGCHPSYHGPWAGWSPSTFWPFQLPLP